MVTASYIMDIPQSSHDTRYIIDFVRKLYTKSATYIPRFKFALVSLIIVPTVIVMSIPFLLILLCIIKISKIRLKNSLKKEIKISLTNYQEAKEMQSSLQKDLSSIQETIDTLNGKSVFISSVFINDIKHTHSILADFQKRLTNSLSDLSKNDNEGQYFVLIQEQTLWNNRVKAYQYRL